MGALSLVFAASLFASSSILGVLVWFSFALFFIKVLLSDYQIKFDFLDILIILWFITMFISTAFSSLLPQSLWGLYKMLTYLAFYCTIKNIMSVDFKRIYYFLFLISALVSLESLYVIHQNFVGVDEISGWQDISNLNSEQVLTRVYGTLKPFNPNLLAGYLLACFPFLGGSLFIFLKEKKYHLCALSLTMLLVTALGILFSGCRGAYIGLLFEMLVFFSIFSYFIWNDFKENKLLKKVWLWTIILTIAALGVLVLSSDALQARIMSIFALRDDSSNSFRLNVYQSSFKMFFDNFVVGIGIGNKVFREIYGLYMRSGFDALGAYSVFLETAVETGIIGVLALASFIFVMIFSSVKKIGSQIPLSHKILISVVLIGIVGMMMHGIADTIWFRPQVQIVFWALTAVLGAVLNENKEDKNVS